MTHISIIPTECQARIRTLLSKDRECESGCFITKTWELIPFKNCSPHPVGHIQASNEDIMKMTDLLLEDKLFGWAHSHPHWPAIPSLTDITFHQYPVYMVIYSLTEENMRIYSPEDIDEIEKSRIEHKNNLKLLTKDY